MWPLLLLLSCARYIVMAISLVGNDGNGDEQDVTQRVDAEKPSTSKQEEGKPVINTDEPAGKAKVAENLKHESDSETQNTSCSEESIEESKSKVPGPLENLKLLSSTVDELLDVIKNKA